MAGVLQGCSLLFVAKGKTGFVAVKSQEVPKAKSLSREMDRTDVIHHKVEDGETLRSRRSFQTKTRKDFKNRKSFKFSYDG
jgi:hypothetical protein